MDQTELCLLVDVGRLLPSLSRQTVSHQRLLVSSHANLVKFRSSFLWFLLWHHFLLQRLCPAAFSSEWRQCVCDHVQLWIVGWNKQTCWRRHFGLIVTTFLTIFRVWTKQTINGSTEKRIQMSSSSTNSRKILLWHERTRTEDQTQRTPDSPEYFTLITFDRLHSHTVTEGTCFHCNRVLFYCGISTSTAVNNVNILQALTGSSSQTCWMCFHPRCEMLQLTAAPCCLYACTACLCGAVTQVNDLFSLFWRLTSTKLYFLF